MSANLNLKKSIISEYWKKTDPRMAKILNAMESAEYWVADDVESVAERMAQSGKKMGEASKKTLAKLAENIIFLMAYMSSSKFFRIIKWMDETHPGLSIHYIMESRQTQDDFPPAKLMVDRIQTINSLDLMGKVFAPARTRLIEELLKRDDRR